MKTRILKWTGLFALSLLGSGLPLAAWAGTIERVSVGFGVTEGNGESWWPAINSNGQFVAFAAYAGNLVINDHNNLSDIFVRDVANGSVERISVGYDGSDPSGQSSLPAISADGRFVAFLSSARNLVPGQTNDNVGVFVFDRVARTTEWVGVAFALGESFSLHYTPALSADGRFVAFFSSASNLVPGDNNNAGDIFVMDRQTREIERVSVAHNGAEANAGSWRPSISADGWQVAFCSTANNLVAGDSNGANDVFVRDRLFGFTERVSVSSAGAQADRNCEGPSISADGRYVVFHSWSGNLVPGVATYDWNIYLRDLWTMSTECVSLNSTGQVGNAASFWPRITPDGRYVVFTSSSSNLVTNDTNGTWDLFVRDRFNEVTERVNVSAAGGDANGSISDGGAMSDDSRFVAFMTNAKNLVANDNTDGWQVFVRDRQSGVNSLVALGRGVLEANGGSGRPSMSSNGRFVAFHSTAANLVEGMSFTNGWNNIFVRDRLTGNNECVTVGYDGLPGNANSSWPAISADGRFVAFLSGASNLVTNDTDGQADVFLYDRQTRQMELVALALANGGDMFNDAYRTALSSNGQYLAFWSSATNLVAGDSNARPDIFVYDRQSRALERVSVATGGGQANNDSYDAAISADGRCVAFRSYASNLVPGNSYGVYVRDRLAATTECISVRPDGGPANNFSYWPALSADGRFVSFASDASNLVTNDTNSRTDILVRDRVSQSTERINITGDGGQANDTSDLSAISDDGRYVVFVSYASNLVGDDNNGVADIFVCDRQTKILERISVAQDGAEGNDASYLRPAISGDGRFVAFSSTARNLVPGDNNGAWDVFVVDRTGGVAPAYQPDLMLRRADEGLYVGDNVYTVALQTKNQSVFAGETAIFHLDLQNDGNAADSFVITVTGPGTGWTANYFNAVAGGSNITALITSGGGWRLKTTTPGASATELRVEITPAASLSPGSSATVHFTARSVANGAKTDTVSMNVTVMAQSGAPQGRTYTLDADFDAGVLVGVEHETVHDQLQLAQNATTFPFIWVPNSGQDTVSKVDTRTGRELGRYRVGPPGHSLLPSRTSVDLRGNCWLGNRQCGTAVKIGLLENGGWIDRNGNGVCDTSRDLDGDGNISDDEMLPWGQDECVLYEVVLIPGYEGTFVPGTYTGTYANDYNTPGPRGIAVDAANNCWVGTFGTRKYYYISGADGHILRTVDISSVNHHPYGALMDASGILWSAGVNDANLLRLDPVADSFSTLPLTYHPYGLGLDRNAHLFASGDGDQKLGRVNVAAGVVEWTRDGASSYGKGVAVTDDGDVWVAEYNSGEVSRWSNDGTLKARIPAGSLPSGVSVDSAGKVWVVNYGDEYIKRIDPSNNRVDLAKHIVGGGGHYGYSDMTGVVASHASTTLGTWTIIHDAAMPDTPWGMVSWSNALPAGTTLTVQTRSSEDRQSWSPWETAANGVGLSLTPNGRFLQVQVAMQRLSGSLSPILYDLTITPAPIIHQPDMHIRNRGEVAYLGDNIYNSDGASQTKPQNAPQGLPAVFQMRLENDGNITDTSTLTGTAGGAGWTVRYYDALADGNEVTGWITGAGWSPPPVKPGSDLSLRVEVTPDNSVPTNTTKEVLVTARAVAQPAKADAVKAVITAVQPPGALQCKTWTWDADFDQGTTVGVQHDYPAHDQLQLTTNATTLPFIWVPNSNEGTVSKVDTRTGREVARYRTGPEATANTASPSRTVVDLNGDCWVANRGIGTVVHIGLLEYGAFADRNTNGAIETSHDLNGDGNITPDEVLPWGQDECVLDEIFLKRDWETNGIPGQITNRYDSVPGPRGMAVDRNNDVWVGTYGTKRYYKVSGSSAQLLTNLDVSPWGHTPYGALIDANGLLWSAGAGADHLLWYDPSAPSNSIGTVSLGHFAYGIGIDTNAHIFVSGWSDSKLSRVNVNTRTKDWTFDGKYESRGVAVTDDGDVWVADSGPNTLTRWGNNGNMKATIRVGSTPTGVAVDADGYVWVVDYGDEYVWRIDPATNQTNLPPKRIIGGSHYGYSDMTGKVVRQVTTGIGTWTVTHDAQIYDAPWGTLSWNSSTPPGTAITVRARASNDQQQWSDWHYATNGVPLARLMLGRYVQIQATLQRLTGPASPILYDLTLCPASHHYQPDLLVATPAEGTYHGDGVYTTNAADQGVSGIVSGQGAATYYLRLANVSTAPDTITIKGTAGDARWTVRFFDARTGGSEITAALVSAGGWVVPYLSPGSSLEFRVEVSCNYTQPGAISNMAQLTATSAANSSQDAVQAVTFLRSVDIWRTQRFTAAELANLAISGDSADPDGDGIANLREFAFALDPKTADASGLPAAGRYGGYLTLTYRKNKAATDSTYIVEAASDLTAPAWSNAGVLESVPMDMGSYWLITARDSVPMASAPQRLLRLRVVGPAASPASVATPLLTVRFDRGQHALTLSLPTQLSQSYTLITATNLALPPAQWETLTNWIGDGSVVSCTDRAQTNLPARFYRVRTP